MSKRKPPVSFEECIAFASGLVNDPSGEALKEFLRSDPRFAPVIMELLNKLSANPEIMKAMTNQSGIPAKGLLESHERLKTACVEVMGENGQDESLGDAEEA